MAYARRRTREEWQKLVTAWQKSGQSRREFSAKHGLNPRTLSWYRTQLKYAQPIVDKLRTWILEQKDKPRVIQRPKSPFAKAIKYLDRQWGRLIMFLEHPEIAVHNNRSELLLRTPVIGRRNWLFAGSPQGATASAIHYSIVATCMLLVIDPMEYLDDVLPRLPNMKRSEVAAVTPAKWAAARREAPVAT